MRLLVKLSGKVLEEVALRREVCRQICELWLARHQIVIVHGAGKQLSDLCKQLGIPVVQHQGRRVTDERTLEAAKMVFSAVNCDLVALLASFGAPALGLTAFDGLMTVAARRPPLLIQEAGSAPREVDFGLVGEIREVRADRLQALLDLRLLPVICSLCADLSGQIFNINADTLACDLAIALGCERLVSISDVEGIYLDPKDPATRIRRMSALEARRYLDQGSFTEGMIPKVETALKAVENGVAAFQVASGTHPNALLDALEEKAGTLLTR
jgi:acetylglutamate kinase